ncbi:hypothetical protein TNCV_308821 [Trichonephila clavipes]|nr:hypothetical protein TNCV_308821 [Trichonephila clavipes]
MAQMETDPPDITNSCEERNRLSLEIEALDIVINRCTELVNFPDTDDNHEMKAILRASIEDTQRKKDTMVSELRSLPPCMTFNCNGNYCTPSPPIPTEKNKDSDSNHILKNYSEASTNANNAKKKNKKKRKINKKDSVEDFVFPKKTARHVSPLPIQFSKLTRIIQSKPLMRSHAPAIPLVPATDFHAHHHQPRSKTKPILKQDRGMMD